MTEETRFILEVDSTDDFTYWATETTPIVSNLPEINTSELCKNYIEALIENAKVSGDKNIVLFGKEYEHHCFYHTEWTEGIVQSAPYACYRVYTVDEWFK